MFLVTFGLCNHCHIDSSMWLHVLSSCFNMIFGLCNYCHTDSSMCFTCSNEFLLLCVMLIICIDDFLYNLLKCEISDS